MGLLKPVPKSSFVVKSPSSKCLRASKRSLASVMLQSERFFVDCSDMGRLGGLQSCDSGGFKAKGVGQTRIELKETIKMTPNKMDRK